MIDFGKVMDSISREELSIILKIMKRTADRFPEIDRTSLMMDLEVTHVTGNGLKLEELFHADDFNFFHDVMGIRAHMDRKTGKLIDCFLPRFSA